ncbi:MAG TPA: lipocalin-like domain-containing protein [Rhodocyclaceae bacterium]|nr:lipocalin-like domain-containing protein [Rhodocyclaceae bacterium]HNE17577.1 lipocalin-like domain-containing protein [Rhodocyclaceae bacterium]
MQRRRFLGAVPGLAIAWAGRARAGADGFARVVPGRRLSFPADHGAHPAFRTEWWYVTGWLTLPDGQPLGFQTTFFRVRTGIGEDNPSAFAPQQLVLAHGALADPRLGHLRHAERVARMGFGRAGFETSACRVWVGDWRFELDGGRYRARVRGEGFAYALDFEPDGAPVLNGVAGFSAKAADPRHASYYYSRPQLAVTGQVTREGVAQRVKGLAWLDHEWSSELLPTGAQGWDWIGLNFNDGTSLMAFRLRASRGEPLGASATLRTRTGVHTVPATAVAFEPLRTWTSSRTGIRYPVAWRVRVADRLIELQPLLDDQELDSRRSTGAVYWEGAVRALEGGRETGRGYLEMTGYGDAIRLGARGEEDGSA